MCLVHASDASYLIDANAIAVWSARPLTHLLEHVSQPVATLANNIPDFHYRMLREGQGGQKCLLFSDDKGMVIVSLMSPSSRDSYDGVGLYRSAHALLSLDDCAKGRRSLRPSFERLLEWLPESRAAAWKRYGTPTLMVDGSEVFVVSRAKTCPGQTRHAAVAVVIRYSGADTTFFELRFRQPR